MSSPTAEDAQPPAEPVARQVPLAEHPDTVLADDTVLAEGVALDEEALPGEDTLLNGEAAEDEDWEPDYPPDDYGEYEGYEEYEPASPPPVSKIAVAGLLTGVLPLIPVGIALSIAGLVVTRRGRRRGRELAVGGLLGAITWLGVGAVLVTVGMLTHGFHRITSVQYHYAQPAVFTLTEGDCIQSLDAAAPAIVSCTSPHLAEVFATFTLASGSWPGTAAVQRDASEGCSARLSGYLNQQLSISLTQDYVYPSQVDWQGGTRTVVCEVQAASGDLTQSVRAA
jgi:hypothetical protein